METEAETTSFNPYGKLDGQIYAFCEEMKEVGAKFTKELMNGTAYHGLSAEARRLGKVFDTGCDIVKKIDPSAVHLVMRDCMEPLTDLCSVLSRHGAEKMKAHDQLVQTRHVVGFLKLVAERLVDPLEPELIERWGGLFDVLCTSKAKGLLESGIALWRASFGKVSQKPLPYPDGLREKLEKMAKRHNLYLPAPESAVFLDDDDEKAMDGLPDGKEDVTAPPEASEDVESCTYQLSQQADANELADKLLQEQKKQEQQQKQPEKKGKTTVTTPRRRSELLASMIDDDDSTDFVPIKTTPPSSLRPNRLTDRQREKLAEASEPRTTVNYVDEESQSAPARAQRFKAALAAANYDLSEESQPAPTPKKEEKKEEQLIDLPRSIPRYPRRVRKLFDESPAKVATPEATTPVKTTTTPSDEVIKEDEEPETEEERVTTPETVAITPEKRKGRPKKTPRQCLPDKSPPRKRVRPAKEDAQKASSEEPEDVVMVEDAPADDVVVEDTVTTAPSIRRIKEKEQDATSSGSPSILKKKTNGTPATDKKKNRVHFGEDSILDNVTPPVTPRRLQTTAATSMVLAIDTKSPQKPSDATTTPEATVTTSDSPSSFGGLLELQHLTSPFFASLVGCQDSIETVLRSLSAFNLKTAHDATRRSLHAAGVRTVGDLAAMPRRQILELEIRKPRDKSAKSVLAEYEAKKRAETRASEERILQEEQTEDVVVVAVEKPLETATSGGARKSLAPIFEKTKPVDVKKQEPPVEKPPLKPTDDTAKTTTSSGLRADCRALQTVSQTLSVANFLKKVPAAEWAAHLTTLCKAVMLFDQIAAKNRWDDVDDDEDDDEDDVDDDDAENRLTSPEDVRAAVKTLNRVYRRFLRHFHTLPDTEWRRAGAMHAVTEAALLLRNIVTDQKTSTSSSSSNDRR